MNKQNTEQLKKEFKDRFCYGAYMETEAQSPEEYTNDIWNFFLPHLISSDEIKREAEYRTTYAPILEKSAVHRFIEDLDDRTIYDKEELLGIWAESYLTQSKGDKE